MDHATRSAPPLASTATSNGDSPAGEQPPATRAAPRPFVTTKEHRRFTEFADAVRRDRYIGLCYGPPGVGKTLSASHYADWDVVDRYLGYYSYLNQTKPGAVPAPAELLRSRTIVYTPKMHNTPRTIDTGVRHYHDRLNWAIQTMLDPGTGPSIEFDLRAQVNTELLIVDEADRLKTPSLEQVRDHYDRTGIGLILIGMPGIEKRLARYPQLYSRVGFVHHYRTLSATEQAFIMARHWPHLNLAEPSADDDYTTAEAVAAIARITGGNFRLINRLLAQIERILEINHLSVVTSEVVDTARESLVVGTQ